MIISSVQMPLELYCRSILTLWNIGSLSVQLELLAAEGGAAAKLLDAICNGSDWPPSLRDMAGGCLGEIILSLFMCHQPPCLPQYHIATGNSRNHSVPGI